jgi:hypothetical protein
MLRHRGATLEAELQRREVELQSTRSKLAAALFETAELRQRAEMELKRASEAARYSSLSTANIGEINDRCERRPNR